jgi:hypothetical protein
MQSAQTGIFKRENVTMAGHRHLTLPTGSASPSDDPQARIVEQVDGGAIIEVPCSCGKRVRVHCTYVDPPA